MTRAYVVTEGTFDSEILKRLLPEAVVAHTVFTAGSGRYGAHALASTILAVKRRPLALVVDADTEDESLIREQEEFSRELLSQAAAGIPFTVLTAVPQMEAVFFQDKAVLEQLADQKLEDREWTIAKHHPKQSITAVLGRQPRVVEAILDDLSDETVRLIQQHPLIAGLVEFLSTTVEAGT
jgi:hypothetical protein